VPLVISQVAGFKVTPTFFFFFKLKVTMTYVADGHPFHSAQGGQMAEASLSCRHHKVLNACGPGI
jgi:hypothetical protein